MFVLRNKLVSIFDVADSGGTLREFCDLSRGIGRKNLRENAEERPFTRPYENLSSDVTCGLIGKF